MRRTDSRELAVSPQLNAPHASSKGPDVAIFSLNYPPEPTGIASYAGALSTGLAAAGYRVAAHVAHPHYPEWNIHEGFGQWTQTEQAGGVDITRRLHSVPNPPRGVRRLLSEITFGIRLLCARWGSPRVVIALSPPLFATAMAAIRLRLTPQRPRLIVWVQDIYSLGLAETGEGGRMTLKITRWVEARTLRLADQVVVLHQRFADFLAHELGVDATKVVVFRNWTHIPPSEPINGEEAKVALGWPLDKTLAVHTGNMGAKQGLENIVDAARLADKESAPVQFILVGDGGERRALEQDGQGVSRLTFVDPLNDEKYRLALAAADVLVVNEKPGVSGMSMPCKLTSYFDAGRPVVAATDPNGITASEVAMADAGSVVEAGHPNALLDAVLALREDRETAARFGANGRRHREAVLGESTAIENWKALIERVAPLS